MASYDGARPAYDRRPWSSRAGAAFLAELMRSGEGCGIGRVLKLAVTSERRAAVNYERSGDDDRHERERIQR
ncbi:MAG: hypothetical protein M3N29_00190 [Chloroflexota bacterium]|nr:hypothetical protein [Chloroflexota bacterium]